MCGLFKEFEIVSRDYFSKFFDIIRTNVPVIYAFFTYIGVDVGLSSGEKLLEKIFTLYVH